MCMLINEELCDVRIMRIRMNAAWLLHVADERIIAQAGQFASMRRLGETHTYMRCRCGLCCAMLATRN